MFPADPFCLCFLRARVAQSFENTNELTQRALVDAFYAIGLESIRDMVDEPLSILFVPESTFPDCGN